MAFHRVQVADRHGQAVFGSQPQLSAERRLRHGRERGAIGDGGDARGAQPKIPTQVLGHTPRHRHDRAAERGRDAHGNPSPQATGVVAAPVHRQEMRNLRAPSGPRAVHGHRKFVAVRQRDPVTLQGPHEPTREGRRERAIEPKRLHPHARAADLACEPALALGRRDDEVVGSRRLERGSETRHHALRTSGTIRLDEVRQTQAAQVHGWKPTVQASNAASVIPAGTFSRRRVH